MLIDKLVDLIPLWGVMILTFALVMIASEVGHWVGQRRARSASAESEGQVNALTAAHLGLMAFIMAFTFSAAVDLTMKRKRLILEEANTIQEVYLRAGLLGGTAASNIQDIVVDYAHTRARIVETTRTMGIDAALEGAERLHADIWTQLGIIAENEDISELHGLLVDSVNKLVSLHNQRVAAGVRTRIPSIIWSSLYGLLLMSMLGMGYFNGMQERRSPVATTALAISFSLVITLIADLDRPMEGLMKPDQSLMKEMAEKLG